MTAAQSEIGLVVDAFPVFQNTHRYIFGAVIDNVGQIPNKKRIASSTSTTRLISSRSNREPETIHQRIIRHGFLQHINASTNSLSVNVDLFLQEMFIEKHDQTFVTVIGSRKIFIEPGVVADLSRLQEPYCDKVNPRVSSKAGASAPGS